jgi:hypothetical protein
MRIPSGHVMSQISGRVQLSTSPLPLPYSSSSLPKCPQLTQFDNVSSASDKFKGHGSLSRRCNVSLFFRCPKSGCNQRGLHRWLESGVFSGTFCSCGILVRLCIAQIFYFPRRVVSLLSAPRVEEWYLVIHPLLELTIIPSFCSELGEICLHVWVFRICIFSLV